MPIFEHAMKHLRHFDTREAAYHEAIQIWKMIVDIDRNVRMLDCDIATEEERIGISDRSDVAHPILARTLAIRRDNLKDTISARTATFRAGSSELVADLEKAAELSRRLLFS
jgi:hypothetical protein